MHCMHNYSTQQKKQRITPSNSLLVFTVNGHGFIYILYTKSIGEICRRHNVLCHRYADDIQLYCAGEGSEDLAANFEFHK